jgi:hypothetical protein
MVTHPLTGDVTELLRNAGIQDLSRINVPVTPWLLAAIPALTAVAFGSALWFTTGRGRLERPGRGTVALLVVQAVIAALSTPGYFFIVAAQVPLVFVPAAALMWLFGQLLVVAALVVGSAWSGADVIIPEMAGAPQPVAFAVSLIYVSGWQILAFGVGDLGSQRRS